jgi:glycosyltransferase involved in cell wall biosynthesis
LKICQLTTYLALGDDNDSGIGQHHRILADALTEQGHDVHVFYLCSPDTAIAARSALASLSPRWRCTLVTDPLPRWLVRILGSSWPAFQLLSHLRLARAARKAILKAHRYESFEIIETHSFNLPAFFLLAARPRPMVLTRVSTTMGQIQAISAIHSRVLRWEAALEKRVIQQSDALVTHTIQHRNQICTDEGFIPSRFAIIPHGLPDHGEPQSFEVHSTDQIEFLYVGRFESRKGIDILLGAIPEITASFPSIRFTLVGARGDGVIWQAFERKYPALAGSRVVSLGRVSAEMLLSLYQRCAVFVAPSRYESFGLIHVEAMSHGKPVVGCKSGGTIEIITDGVTGLLAEPGDIASLVKCMRRLANDAGLRRRMGEAARADFIRRFSARRLAEASATLYRQLSSK